MVFIHCFYYKNRDKNLCYLFYHKEYVIDTINFIKSLYLTLIISRRNDR